MLKFKKVAYIPEPGNTHLDDSRSKYANSLMKISKMPVSTKLVLDTPHLKSSTAILTHLVNTNKKIGIKNLKFCTRNKKVYVRVTK